MDTVKEENSPVEEQEQPFLSYQDNALSNVNAINNNTDDVDGAHNDNSTGSSRRTSTIIAALRRPSQAIALTAAHAVMNQRRYLLSLVRSDNDTGASADVVIDEVDLDQTANKYDNKIGDDALTTILSALYAKLLVVLGIAFPITETISTSVNSLYYQGFYLYLYLGSIAFVMFMYITLIKEKAVFSILTSYQRSKRRKKFSVGHGPPSRPERYGSLYLRLGAIGFGIGSMVYSGLEFGRYFELRNNQDCLSHVLQAVTPATRMILTLVQIQFIFLNSKDIELNRHKIVARFGLMHMVATNLCEWLYVLVEETKHEIIHLAEQSNGTFFDHAKYCQNGYLMGSVVTNASTFLFPCTIEYSLICAVILYEMWKKMKPDGISCKGGSQKKTSFDRIFHNHVYGHSQQRSRHHISIDCSNAHRGLFAGILIVVLTIISLIMFFVLNNGNANSEEARRWYKLNAEFEVNVVELVLYIVTTFAVLLAMYQMRCLKYDRNTEGKGSGIGLDNTLLVVAQAGVFIYCIFSLIGCHFTISYSSPTGLVTEVFSFIQTCLQTMFVLDGWWRRCRNLQQTKRKPGRELVTFLIIANMAMWTINAMEKNRAEFRPSHLNFFGDWAWTIITHISMPLVIFYRFHSTICLFEIWKSAYKFKDPHGKHHFLPYFRP